MHRLTLSQSTRYFFIKQDLLVSTSELMNELELLELKKTSIRHIILGLVLLSILPFFLFLIFYTLLGSFVLFIILTPGLGLWLFYEGITGYKEYKRVKKQQDPPDLFT